MFERGETPAGTALQASFAKLPELVIVKRQCCMREVEHAQLRKVDKCLPRGAQQTVSAVQERRFRPDE